MAVNLVIKGLMMAATAASGAVSAYSAIQQGKDAEKQAEYNASVVRNNATQDKFDALTREQTAKNNSDAALLEANEKKRRMLREANVNKSKGVAQLARQGLSVGSVSFDDALSSQLALDEAQAGVALFEGAMSSSVSRREGLGARVMGDRALSLAPSRASAFIAAGKNARASANLSAIGTGLSTISSMGNQYLYGKGP